MIGGNEGSVSSIIPISASDGAPLLAIIRHCAVDLLCLLVRNSHASQALLRLKAGKLWGYDFHNGHH